MKSKHRTTEYDFRPLAKKYARYLPKASPFDWEDVYQEMMLAEAKHHSVRSMRWAALDMIDKERLRTNPFRSDMPSPRAVRLDIICEAYHIIGRWPWLIGLLMEGSMRAVARREGVHESNVFKRIQRIRKKLKEVR